MTIPNILSIIRLILIIPTAIALWNYQNVSAVILCLIGSTLDILDGTLARKLNQISELGKILDPLADKLFIGTLSIILLCQGRIPVWFFIAVVLRDVLIMLGGLYFAKRIKFVLPSNYPGKLTASALGLTMLGFMLNIQFTYSYFIYFTFAMMLYSLLYYLWAMLKALEENTK